MKILMMIAAGLAMSSGCIVLRDHACIVEHTQYMMAGTNGTNSIVETVPVEPRLANELTGAKVTGIDASGNTATVKIGANDNTAKLK